MGETQGAVSKKNNAYNAGVSTTEVEVRSEDADLAYQTAAVALEIVSGSSDDDGKSTGTLTLASAVALTGATGTATLLSVIAGDTITLNGLIYLAVSGTAVEGEFDIDGNNDANAVELAAAINIDTRTGTEGVASATSATNVVTITTDVVGADGNDVTLTSQDSTITVSGSGTLTGGLDADVATVNGLTYTGVTGPRANDSQFSVDTSDTAAAADLAAAINADFRTPITVPTADVVATSAVGVVTINQDGIIGDLVDISGTSNITASDTTLSNVGTGARTVLVEGLDATYAEISETVFLNGTAVVALVNSYFRVNKLTVKQVGSGLMNAGLITVRLASAGAIQLVIPADEGVSQAANFTVSLGKEISIKSLDYTVASAGGNALVVLVKLFKKLFGSGWELVESKTLGNGQSITEFNNDELEMPQRTDIKITALQLTGTGDARVDVSYGFREYKKTT